MRSVIFAAATAVVLGCSSPQPVKWPELHPAKGVVKIGGKAVSGGFVHFRAEEAALSDFVVTGNVAADGSFTLTTGHAQDPKTERKPGAPAGKYIVTYSPPQADQTAGKPALPTQGTRPTTIVAGENNLTVELTGKK